jgi:hypothetical protein
MLEFKSYFSDDALIRRLCVARMKLADSRHKSLFYRQIFADAPLLESPENFDFLPPRRLWSRFRNKNRSIQAVEDQNLVALTRATLRLRSERPDDPWALSLGALLERIRARALGGTPFRFTEPRIVPVGKDASSGQYRPIAQFALEDGVIEKSTAAYLRKLFDPFFSRASLAFRCSNDGTPPPTHHDAIAAIQNYRKRHLKTGLYVAECDIRSFFDSVSHKTAWNSLLELIEHGRSLTEDFYVHPQALQIFKAYLRCYSFTGSVRRHSRGLLRGKPKQPAIFPWPLEELCQFHARPGAASIGIPQGGALSCFIANCVLHHADVSVEQSMKKTGGPFRYLRYCDDMLLLAPNKRDCRRAFNAYQKALGELKLPIHTPESVRVYGRVFWSKKSLNPFRWGRPLQRSTVPWIQFVGYQIRYDGLIRIKQKSIAKHRAKILDETEQMLRLLGAVSIRRDGSPDFSAIKKNPKQILHRFRQKLISISVGRRAVHHDLRSPIPKCWAAGFRMLAGKRIQLSNLKDLDRFRGRQIAWVAQKLKGFPKKIQPPVSFRTRPPAYYGFPFSYVGQFAGRPKPRR